jgi:Ser/Thr protein kinase RdoA (MazF antagonist)
MTEPGPKATIPNHVRRAFDLQGPARLLSGGSVDVYQVGDRVVKPIHLTSLETHHSLELLPWLADLLANVPENGFRISRPLASQDGRWMTADGWTTWTFVHGRPAVPQDIPACIDAIRALHRAISPAPKHPLLDQNDTAWGFAHKHCWGDRPARVHPALADGVDALYARLKPLPPMPSQLIHGDLNAENVLVAPGLPPGFIDLTPFWAPVDFALAMFANWIGPRRGDPTLLRHFGDIPYFDQLLVRAAIRMLLVVSHLEGVDEWEEEKKAMEIVLDYTS